MPAAAPIAVCLEVKPANTVLQLVCCNDAALHQLAQSKLTMHSICLLFPLSARFGSEYGLACLQLSEWWICLLAFEEDPTRRNIKN